MMIVKCYLRKNIDYQSERKGYLTKRRFQAPENIRYRLKKICSDIDIKPLSPHKLRHLTATILLKDGIPINQVKEVLGHTSVKTTGDIYGHVLPSMQVNVISTLSNIGM